MMTDLQAKHLRRVYWRLLIQQILKAAPYEPTVYHSRIDGLLL
jgi:hypothetical protein